nr:TetR/AcrR family transcriptional regulator [Trinickia mobilis]
MSREVSDRHKEEIEIASAKLFREHGLNGISVAEVMAAVGLSHGSFYSHFDSKDELAALACNRSFDQSMRQWTKILSSGVTEHEALLKIIKWYLRDGNVSSVPDCAAATLAADVTREPSDKLVRQAYNAGVDKLTTALQTKAADSGGLSRPDALTLLSTLVGALMLARATKGSRISSEIRESVVDRLSNIYGT